MSTEVRSAQIFGSIAEIGRQSWDEIANPGWPSGKPLTVENGGGPLPYNPFIAFDFLDCLEQSGCATERTGWQPHHLALVDDSRIIAAMPLYLKSHSMGEYVFDHGWADAYQRAGGRYYPKLQSSVPFTPATGRRLLTAPGTGDFDLQHELVRSAAELAERRRLSSVHITFLPKSESDLVMADGYLQRIDQQFRFVSHGYRDFDDFLQSLVARKRKVLKRERREAQSGVDIELLTGSDITETHWDAFFDFYTDTGNRKWGRPYLNRAFFSMICERMADRILLAIASENGRPIAGALNFIGSDTLYGRYWGAIEHRPFLHFELCYYQAVEWALSRGLKYVEAGAQGEHKLARGYAPTTTYSAHWINDPRFRAAVDHYLSQETEQVEIDAAHLKSHMPFRRS